MSKWNLSSICNTLPFLKNSKNNRRKKTTHLTMMVVPHGHQVPVRSIFIPMWLVKSFIALSISCILVVGYFISGFFWLKYVAEENKELKEVTSAQEKEIKELKGMAGDMRGKLEALIKLDNEVRTKIGLKKPETEKASTIEGSRTVERYSFMTMGLNTPDVFRSGNVMSPAMIPYVDDPVDNTAIYGEEQATVEDILELPLPEGEADTLGDLKDQLAQLDLVLTHQAENITKLNSDVDKRLAYEKALPDFWPLQGRITCTFGWRKNPFSHKSSEFHEGIDIASSYGAPIKAAGDGVVLFSGWKGSWGRIVIISHGYGYVSQYAHNSSNLVNTGDKVKKGQIIARLGSTGRSTGPHIHFGVAQNGKWINPYKVTKR